VHISIINNSRSSHGYVPLNHDTAHCPCLHLQYTLKCELFSQPRNLGRGCDLCIVMHNADVLEVFCVCDSMWSQPPTAKGVAGLRAEQASDFQELFFWRFCLGWRCPDSSRHPCAPSSTFKWEQSKLHKHMGKLMI
jgi:hypothetical protein